MSSTMDDRNKHVSGYPTTTYPPPPQTTAYPPPQHQPTAYPPPQNSYPATGVGYPYRPQPPPPAAHYNPNPYPQSNYTPQRSTFLRRAIIAGISLCVIIGAIIFITWLIIRPQVPEISVNSASVSNFSLSSSQLTSNWEIGLLIRNPNKRATIYYDQIEGAVFYKDNSLTQKSLQPFVQNTKTQRILTSSFTASSTFVGDRRMMEIIRDRNNGGVNFNFKMLALIRFKSGIWWTRRRLMRVHCENIKIEFLSSTSSTGKLAAGMKNCRIIM